MQHDPVIVGRRLCGPIGSGKRDDHKKVTHCGESRQWGAIFMTENTLHMDICYCIVNKMVLDGFFKIIFVKIKNIWMILYQECEQQGLLGISHNIF